MKYPQILVILSIATFILGVNPVITVAASSASNQASTKSSSHSNPDGATSLQNTNTKGVDKPYSASGQAAQTQGGNYYDGNNGCGQDKKYDIAPDGGFHNGYDDNNGWCGTKKSKTIVYIISTPTPAPNAAPASTATSFVNKTTHGGEITPTAASTTDDEVKAVAINSLAFTGHDYTWVTSVIGGFSIFAGLVILKRLFNFDGFLK